MKRLHCFHIYQNGHPRKSTLTANFTTRCTKVEMFLITACVVLLEQMARHSAYFESIRSWLEYEVYVDGNSRITVWNQIRKV